MLSSDFYHYRKLLFIHELCPLCNHRGARWLSGRVSDSGAKGPGFETYLRRVVSLHFTPRKYWLITQEAMAPSRHDWKIVDRDVKPQHNQPLCNLYSKPV